MVKDEMVCICGQTLYGQLDANGSTIKGSLAKEYEEHIRRDDHKPSPQAWTEAAIKLDKQKEAAKRTT